MDSMWKVSFFVTIKWFMYLHLCFVYVHSSWLCQTNNQHEECLHEGFSHSGDPTPNFTANRWHKAQIKKREFTGFWDLIYQHMVSGNATEVEKLPLDFKDKGEQDEEDHTLSHDNSPVSH